MVMTIREFRQSDIPRIEELWEQKGFECAKPDWEKIKGMVLVDDLDVVRETVLDRVTTELYFLVDHGDWAAPGMKWTQCERLHEAELKFLAERGFEDVHAWVPHLWRGFARKLRKFLGWVNSDPDGTWIGMTRDV